MMRASRAVLVACLFMLTGEGICGGRGSPGPLSRTGTYVFVADKSMVVQTGGFAGVDETYAVRGSFQVTLDFTIGMAFFDRVDATLIEESPFLPTHSLNDLFNMTKLTGIILSDTLVEFMGKTANGTGEIVLLCLSLAGGQATLTGRTIPPPNSADFFVFTIEAVARRKYAGGTGEPNDPYLICTADQMEAIGTEPNDWDRHFKLISDIDMAACDGSQVNMIGYSRSRTDSRPFTGTFDGDGHRIVNFTYYSDASGPAGLFGYVSGPSAEIANLTLVGPNIEAEGADCVGSLIGFLRDGTVSLCHARGGRVSGGLGVGGLIGVCDRGGVVASSAVCDVRGRSAVGGLIGHCSSGTVLQSASGGSVISTGSAGGLVGSIGPFFGAIADSYSDADVCSDGHAGGLVGVLGLGSGISRCHAAGAVSGTDRKGGLVGFGGNVVGYKPDVVASFWDIDAAGQTSSAGGEGKTTTEMRMRETFVVAGWDFVGETANGTEDIWWIEEGQDRPRLIWEREGEQPAF